MYGAFKIAGFAIASVDGNIADHTGLMPNSLKLEADQALFEEGCENTDVVIHGHKSHEAQANSSRRRRLIMSRKVKGVIPHPEYPKAKLWNPGDATLAEACAAVGCAAGQVGVLGGPDVYSHFLQTGYDLFVLCRAVKVELPGGVPVFAEMRDGLAAEEVFGRTGHRLVEERMLDDECKLTIWALM